MRLKRGLPLARYRRGGLVLKYEHLAITQGGAEIPIRITEPLSGRPDQGVRKPMRDVGGHPRVDRSLREASPHERPPLFGENTPTEPGDVVDGNHPS